MSKEYLRHWVLIDLNVWRHIIGPMEISEARTIDNLDHTQFKRFDLRKLPPEAFIGISDTMKVALERGLEAVQPINQFKKSTLNAPPCLQALVAQYGGYSNIPAEAWAQYDAEIQEWKQELRTGAGYRNG